MTLNLGALVEFKAGTCQHCEREIFWHPSACRWLHTETRITICDHNSSTPTTALPKEDE